MASPEEAVAALELSLLDPAIRASAAELDRLLATEFVEFASTGRAFDKQEVLSRLPSERGLRFHAHEMRTQLLGPGAALVTYEAERTDTSGTRRSLRSSMWVLSAGQWRMVFHQGTPVGDGG